MHQSRVESGQSAEWTLDDQIDQIRRLSEVWCSQARKSPPGPYGELVCSIASGYRTHLRYLLAARAGLCVVQAPDTHTRDADDGCFSEDTDG